MRNASTRQSPRQQRVGGQHERQNEAVPYLTPRGEGAVDQGQVRHQGVHARHGLQHALAGGRCLQAGHAGCHPNFGKLHAGNRQWHSGAQGYADAAAPRLCHGPPSIRYVKFFVVFLL